MPTQYIHTDGSRDIQKNLTAADFYYPKGNIEAPFALPSVYSSFAAEMYALKEAILMTLVQKETNRFIIVADSLSALELLRSLNYNQFDSSYYEIFWNRLIIL